MASNDTARTNSPTLPQPDQPVTDGSVSCVICKKRVNDGEQSINCGGECQGRMHRVCAGLSEKAFRSITAEPTFQCHYCQIKALRRETDDLKQIIREQLQPPEDDERERCLGILLSEDTDSESSPVTSPSSSSTLSSQKDLEQSVTKSDGIRTACFAYPCSVNWGITPESTVEFVKRHYDIGKRTESDHLRQSSEKHLHLILPQLEGKNILGMGWDDVKRCAERRFPGGSAVDKTMMKNDFKILETLEKPGILKPQAGYMHVIEEVDDTQVKNLGSFLKNGSCPEEVKVLTIIGHGLSEEHAVSLSCKDNLPRYDGKDCIDKSIREKIGKDEWVWKSCMKNKEWCWDLTNCDGTEGLGKGYTAKSVCEKAKKGDIVAFSAGFITPEWVLEQLYEREKNQTSITLVLLVDACYSGVWIERMQRQLEAKSLQYTRLIVQTACASDQVSFGKFFIPLWCNYQMSDGDYQRSNGDLSDQMEIKCVQTPQYFDSQSDKGEGGIGLKFFKDGCTFEKYCESFFTRASKNDIYQLIRNFSRAEIKSYKLKEHSKAKTPMALIFVEFNNKLLQLHIHFNDYEEETVTGFSLFDVIKNTPNNQVPYVECTSSPAHPVYIPRVDSKDLQQNISLASINQLVQLCKNHVTIDIWNSQPWAMTPSEPDLIRSRSAWFELRDPTNTLKINE